MNCHAGGGGYELAKVLLGVYGDHLLDIFSSDHGKERGAIECDWLELKEFDPDEPLDDRHAWRVARSLISLANFCGGLLVLGVDRAGYLKTPIKSKQPDKPPTRPEVEAAWEKSKSKIGASGSIRRWTSPEDNIEMVAVAESKLFSRRRPALLERRPVRARYRDGRHGYALGILVRQSSELVLAETTRSNNGEVVDVVLARRKLTEDGDTENIRVIQGTDPNVLNDLINERKTRSVQLSQEAAIAEARLRSPLKTISRSLGLTRTPSTSTVARCMQLAAVALAAGWVVAYQFGVALDGLYSYLTAPAAFPALSLLLSILVATYFVVATPRQPGRAGYSYVAVVLALLLRQIISTQRTYGNALSHPTIQCQITLSVLSILSVCSVRGGTVRTCSHGRWALSLFFLLWNLLIMAADTDCESAPERREKWRADNSYFFAVFIGFVFCAGAGWSPTTALGLVVITMLLKTVIGIVRGWLL